MTDRKPWGRKRISANERGYGWRWTKVRQAALERDRYLCQDCLDRGRTTVATQVDHIKPKAKGGGDELSNCRSLCRECHDRKTAKDQGWRIKKRFGLDGWPVDAPEL